MARRTRRRGSNGAWLPIYANLTGAAEDGEIGGIEFEISASENIPYTEVYPLTWDTPLDIESNVGPQRSMADAIGSGYYLKRIVGKAFIGMNQIPEVTYPIACLVGLGFFVARVAGDGQASEEPIGTPTDYNVLGASNTREPWIWRRTWLFSNQDRPAAVDPLQEFPSSTSGYASVMDGPHIDAKTNRKVMGDDRLWAAISVLPLPHDVVWTNSVAIGGYIDYRLFGRLARQKPSGAF